MFKALDKDNSGSLTQKELRPLLKKLSKKQKKKLFRYIDSDNSGDIDLGEFRKYFSHHTK